ncbi:NYN domain-containing protein [Spirillospora sp. NPDC048832]
MRSGQNVLTPSNHSAHPSGALPTGTIREEDVPRMTHAPIRIGVFYDGSFLAPLAHYYQQHHQSRRRIELEGFHEQLCRYASTVFRRQIGEIEVTEAHHFQGLGQPAPATFTAVLDRLKIQRHELLFDHGKNGGGPEGLAVEFALTCHEAAVEVPLDMAVLITGDPDYVPLVDWLAEDHVQVVVPSVYLTFPKRAGHQQCLATASRLLARAAHTPAFDTLLPRRHEFGGERP